MRLRFILPIAIAILTGTAFGAFPTPNEVEKILNLGGAEGIRKVQLGTQITQKKVQVIKGTYDFNRDGGASTAFITLKDADGKAAVIPKSAVIKQVTIDLLHAPLASTGVANISLGITTATDLYAANLVSAMTTMSLISGTATGTAINMLKLPSTIAGRTPSVNITTNSLSQGKFNVIIEYYLSDNLAQ